MVPMGRPRATSGPRDEPEDDEEGVSRQRTVAWNGEKSFRSCTATVGTRPGMTREACPANKTVAWNSGKSFRGRTATVGTSPGMTKIWDRQAIS